MSERESVEQQLPKGKSAEALFHDRIDIPCIFTDKPIFTLAVNKAYGWLAQTPVLWGLRSPEGIGGIPRWW
jgi:hypothetical protein